jgi:hypothetical protein
VGGGANALTAALGRDPATGVTAAPALTSRAGAFAEMALLGVEVAGYDDDSLMSFPPPDDVSAMTPAWRYVVARGPDFNATLASRLLVGEAAAAVRDMPAGYSWRRVEQGCGYDGRSSGTPSATPTMSTSRSRTPSRTSSQARTPSRTETGSPSGSVMSLADAAGGPPPLKPRGVAWSPVLTQVKTFVFERPQAADAADNDAF